MQHADKAFIGTGPISVVDALLASTNGESVLLFDEKEQAGGAWVAIEVGTYGKLEVGCHIWSYNHEAYAFMHDFFNLELIELSPQPYFLKGKTKLVYDHKNAITTLKYSFRHLMKFDFSGLKHYVTKNPAARIPIVPKKYLYPKGGARDLQRSIDSRLEASAIELNLTTKIVELNKFDGLWELKSASNQMFYAKNIVLTSTSGIGSITCNERKIELNHRALNYTHFHIVLKGKLVKPCSYIRVLNNAIIHRISDITYQVEEKIDVNQTVMLVGVFDENLSKTGSNDAVVEEIMQYLADQGFVKKDVEVVYAQKNVFETTYISPDQIQEIKDLDASIDVLSTTDLMYGIHYRLPEWKKLKV